MSNEDNPENKEKNNALLTDIPREKYFHLHDGRDLRNIYDMYDSIFSISDEDFEYFTKNNDFSKWLKGVFNDTEAHDALIKAASKEEYQRVLKEILDNRRFVEDKISVDFHNFLTSGDKKFSLKRYQDALNDYESAFKLKADNAVKAKVEKIKKLLTDIGMVSDMRTKEFAVQVETYNSKYNEITEKIHQLRKEGKDPYIAELRLMNFKAKMHIAEITRLQKDLDTVRNMLMMSEKDLNEAKEERMINVKEEVEEGAKLLIDSDIKKVASS
jgi:hypothetical protein